MYRHFIAERPELLDLRNQLPIVPADDWQNNIVARFHCQITGKIGNDLAFLMHRPGSDSVVELRQHGFRHIVIDHPCVMLCRKRVNQHGRLPGGRQSDHNINMVPLLYLRGR